MNAESPQDRACVVAAMITPSWTGAPHPRDIPVLVARRATGRWAGCWEFPGGKCEPGEAPLVAVVREIREELGCGVGFWSTDPIAHVEILRPFPFAVTLFACRLNPGAIPRVDPRIHTAIQYRPIEYLSALPVDKLVPSMPAFLATLRGDR